MPGQPKWFSALAALGRGMGDTEPELVTMVRGAVPVPVIGAGSALSPPLLAPTSMLGGVAVDGGTAATHAMMQFTATAPGGIRIKLNMNSGGGTIFYRVTAFPVAMVVTVQLFNIGIANGGAGVTAFHGQGPIATFGTNIPAVRTGENLGVPDVFVPHGSTLELLQNSLVNVITLSCVVCDLVSEQTL